MIRVVLMRDGEPCDFDSLARLHRGMKQQVPSYPPTDAISGVSVSVRTVEPNTQAGRPAQLAAIGCLIVLASLLVVQPVQALKDISYGPVFEGPLAGVLPGTDASGCFHVDGTFPFASIDPDCLGSPPGTPPPNPSPDSNSTAPPSNSTTEGQ